MLTSTPVSSPAEPTRYDMKYVWGISLVAALGGLMFGYDWIVISGAEPFYERFFNLTTASEKGWAMGSALIGCLIGAVLSGGLSDKFGRKRLLILAAMVFAVSSIGTAMVSTFNAFNLWRIAGGIAIGLASNLSPMYIAEVSPAAVRGRLVAMNQFTIVIGILLAQTVNYFIAECGMQRDRAAVATAEKQSGTALDAGQVAGELAWQLPAEQRGAYAKRFTELAAARRATLDAKAVAALVDELNEGRKAKVRVDPLAVQMAGHKLPFWNFVSGWSWMFGVTAVPALIFFVLMFLVPESPRWLAKNGKPEGARAVLARIGGAAHADQELAGIEETLAGEIERVNFRDLLEPKMLKILVLGVTLAVLQQWCGLNVIFYYAADIFRDAGYTISAALQNIVIIGAVNLIFTIAAICSVDRFGRRPLMLIGFVGIAVIHALIGASYYTHTSGVLVLVLTLAAIGCYGLSLAPITWVVLSEIFPNRIRGAAMSVSVVSLWAACFILTFTFPHLRDSLGPAGTFWIYSAICVGGFFFVVARLPETKGKTLEEIERELA